MIEIRSDQGVTGALPASNAAAATHLLLVGDGEADIARFANAEIAHASLGEVLDDPVAALAPLAAAHSNDAGTNADKRIVAVTSCPTGIAHTFMAAEGLQQAAKALGHAIRVETQGSVGAQDALSDEEIAAADLVLIAADREVDLSRFAGKRLFKSGTKPAINDGQNLIRKALAEAGVQAGTATSGRTTEKTKATGPYKHLMTGVSFMLPFVTAGGLLIALAFALGGIYAFDDAHKGTLAWSLFQIGAKSGFMLMVPALAGYIAYSIADRPGIAPGMIGGLVAVNMDAGFIGGILAGFIAGYGVHWINPCAAPAAQPGRPQAGADPAGAGHAAGRPVDDVCDRYAGGRAAGLADRLAARHARQQRDPAWPAAGRHDGGGHGRAGQQGVLCVLYCIDFQPGLHADGGDDDRRHDAAAGYCTGDMAVQQPLHRRGARHGRCRRRAWPQFRDRRRDPLRRA